MKKINSLLFFSLCYFFTQAQITFLKSDMPTVGWVNAQQKDTSTGVVVNFGNKGANQVYNFSMFQNNVRDSTFYLAPSTAQRTTVPTANLAVTTDHNTYLLGLDTTLYFAFNGLQTSVNGNTIISNYSQIDTYYKFTTVYGQNFRGTYGGSTVVSGSTLGLSFPVNNVQIINTTTYTDTIDGWGKVTTPIGTYNCLRQKRVENSNTVINYNTVFSSSWTNYQTINSSTTSYNYLAKETHGTVITFTYDSINQPLTASWSTTPPYPVANFGYTLGSSGLVSFTDSSTGPPTTYSWSFGDGSPTSSQISPNHIFTHNGTFWVCLTVTNASGSDTKCDSVHITNISAGTPPVAQITPSGHDTICPGASVVLKAQTGTGYTFKWSNNSTADSIIVNTAGSYTVKVFNTSGDSATSSPTVVVINAPSATLTLTGPATFCTGDSALISAPAGLTYNWSTGATTQSIVARTSNSYTVTVTNGNHCTAVSSPEVITVNIPQSDSITRAGLVLTSQTETNYQWYEGSTLLTGATSLTYTATQNGVYTVHYTDANGCSSVSNSITITGVGINEIAASDYRIYPNPASDMIQIDLSHIDATTLNGLSEIVIYNILGEKLKTLPVNQTSISVKDLSNGVYMIGVVDKNQNRKTLGKFEVLR